MWNWDSSFEKLFLSEVISAAKLIESSLFMYGDCCEVGFLLGLSVGGQCHSKIGMLRGLVWRFLAWLSGFIMSPTLICTRDKVLLPESSPQRGRDKSGKVLGIGGMEVEFLRKVATGGCKLPKAEVVAPRVMVVGMVAEARLGMGKLTLLVIPMVSVI